jgi:hypothetical protein
VAIVEEKVAYSGWLWLGTRVGHTRRVETSAREGDFVDGDGDRNSTKHSSSEHKLAQSNLMYEADWQASTRRRA